MGYSVPTFQKTITATTTNYDPFTQNTDIQNILTNGGVTLPARMGIVFIPDTACTVIVDGYECDCPDFYSTGDLTNIQSFKIKENGTTGLLIFQMQ